MKFKIIILEASNKTIFRIGVGVALLLFAYLSTVAKDYSVFFTIYAFVCGMMFIIIERDLFKEMIK